MRVRGARQSDDAVDLAGAFDADDDSDFVDESLFDDALLSLLDDSEFDDDEADDFELDRLSVL